MHYEGYANVGDGDYQHIVRLDNPQVQEKDTRWGPQDSHLAAAHFSLNCPSQSQIGY
jgi:hypothetical protein